MQIKNWLAAIVLCLGLIFPQLAANALADDNTTVAILITVNDGQSAEEAEKGMKEVVAFIRKQAGLVDETLLKSQFAGNKPSHVHLSHWKSVDSWAALTASQEFLALLDKNGKLFSWKPAEVFLPVK